MNEDLVKRGMVVLGCGKMGSAMLAGWLDAGLPPSSVTVIAPRPSDWLKGIEGLNLNGELPSNPAIVLLAVKPQKMQEAIAPLLSLGNGDTVVLSVAAGITIAKYEEWFGAQTPVIRAMPNTPSAIGRGVTGIVGNANTTPEHLQLASDLLSAVGQVVTLEDELQIRALTAISGCGPAYVFHLIEAMAQAGEAAGLSPDVAMTLAKATVGGAGELAERSDDSPTTLRENVTSPNGVTAEALKVLMDEAEGFRPLLGKAVKAAMKRDEELAG